jgi:hypothetical protein
MILSFSSCGRALHFSASGPQGQCVRETYESWYECRPSTKRLGCGDLLRHLHTSQNGDAPS